MSFDSYRWYTYGGVKYKPFSKTGVNLGIRVTEDASTNATHFEPRASLYQKIGDKIRLKLGFGQYTQFLTKSLSNKLNGEYRNLWLLANKDDVPVLESERIIIGGNIKLGNWMFDTEVYLGRTSGLTEYVTDYFIYMDSTNYDYSASVIEGESQDLGLDLMLNYRNKSFETIVAYSLKTVENKFDLINNGEFFPSLNDQRHELKILQNYQWKNLEFSLGWIYGSGKPYFAPDAYANYIDLPENPTSKRIYHRKPAYHRMDFSVVYKYSLRNKSIDLGLSVFNVYDRKNVKDRVYQSYDTNDVNGTQTFEYATDVLLLGRTPNFFVRFNF